MPHRHSAAAHVARQLRARQYNPSPGWSWLAVPDAIKDRAELAVAALIAHWRLSDLVGFPPHFARQASWAAKNQQTDAEWLDSLKEHRHVNCASHSWTTASTKPPLKGTALDEDTHEDPLMHPSHDPWLAATMTCPRTQTSSQKEGDPWRFWKPSTNQVDSSSCAFPSTAPVSS